MILDRKADRTMSNTYHFQVNLGGMLDVLSNHLYKSPDVFLRELLQNGVDAVTLRQKSQPDWNRGKITITVEPGRRLIFRDNGAGLSEEGIHRFLAVIGQSSKTELVNGRIPEDYIGRFGIGLLSCFMVSDSIVVHTRPAAGGVAHVWTGLPDGTYTLEPLEECPVGTAVILTAKPGMEHYFQPRKVAELVRYYGLALPVPVYLSGDPERLNSIPADFTGVSRSQLLSFGEWLFEEDFLEAIDMTQTAPSLSQAQRIKKLSQEGACTADAICDVMSEAKKPEVGRLTFSTDSLRKYFPKSYTAKQMEETIIRLLEQYMKKRQRDMER